MLPPRKISRWMAGSEAVHDMGVGYNQFRPKNDVTSNSSSIRDSGS